MKWFDYGFVPWTWRNRSEIVVASDGEWRKPLELSQVSAMCGETVDFLCRADVFDDSCAAVVDHDGDLVVTRHTTMTNSTASLTDFASLMDLRLRVFQIIDSTPNLVWHLPTGHKCNVDRMVPHYCPDGKRGCEVLHGPRPNVVVCDWGDVSMREFTG
jgi:hypothetical protein